jgi:hypothetical protein
MQDIEEGRLIVIRKLAALDLTLHGSKFIILEFGLATPILIAFELYLMLTSVALVFGIYLFLAGLNYLVLLVYAVIIVKKSTAEKEVEYGLTHNKHYVRKYSAQQVIIFVPVAIIIIATIQETRLASKETNN